MNPFEVLTSHLTKTGTALYVLNKNRVNAVQLPAGYKNTESGIVVSLQTITAQLNASMWTGQVQFRCYGGSSKIDDVVSIFNALHSRLQNAHEPNNLVLAYLVSMNLIIEPETEWPSVLSVYTVHLAE